MKIKSFFTVLFKWLKSTEMFACPSKQITGKWKLFEYYTEPGSKLINVKEEQLIRENHYWEIEFSDKGWFYHRTNISIPLFSELSVSSKWDLSRNFITFIYPGDFKKNKEFQFAIDKGNLKLLKKELTGRIELFGFFRKLDETR